MGDNVRFGSSLATVDCGEVEHQMFRAFKCTICVVHIVYTLCGCCCYVQAEVGEPEQGCSMYELQVEPEPEQGRARWLHKGETKYFEVQPPSGRMGWLRGSGNTNQHHHHQTSTDIRFLQKMVMLRMVVDDLR